MNSPKNNPVADKNGWSKVSVIPMLSLAFSVVTHLEKNGSIKSLIATHISNKGQKNSEPGLVSTGAKGALASLILRKNVILCTVGKINRNMK
jgi:hypothetical protein